MRPVNNSDVNDPETHRYNPTHPDRALCGLPNVPKSKLSGRYGEVTCKACKRMMDEAEGRL